MAVLLLCPSLHWLSSHICGTCERNETFPDDFDCIKTLVFTRAGAKTEQLDDLDMKFK